MNILFRNLYTNLAAAEAETNEKYVSQWKKMIHEIQVELDTLGERDFLRQGSRGNILVYWLITIIDIEVASALADEPHNKIILEQAKLMAAMEELANG